MTQGFLQSNYQTFTGIQNKISETNFAYFPNPVSNEFCIVTADKIDKIQIYDINGKVVFNQQFENSQINVSQLKSGIYFVKTIDDKQNLIKSFKIIKN